MYNTPKHAPTCTPLIVVMVTLTERQVGKALSVSLSLIAFSAFVKRGWISQSAVIHEFLIPDSAEASCLTKV